MSRRIEREAIVYWTTQIIVVTSAILTICFSLKSSLYSDQIRPRLRGHSEDLIKTKALNSSCRFPLREFENGVCQPPCDWSLVTSFETKIYGYIMSNCLRVAMISTIVTILTWLACKPLRNFPHIVRFYILLSSASFTFAGILPSTLNTSDPHCAQDSYWTLAGITSNMITLQGAVCHYLMLVSCFWLFCYVVNTFVLLVLNKHHIFTNPTKLHTAQLVMCAILPFVFVGICLLVEKPSYQIIFKDRMAILPSSHVLVFCTVTLPVLLSAGVSLTMLVAVVRRIRKVSHDPTTAGQVIRSEEESTSLKSVERHFVAIIGLYALAIIVIFVAETILQDQEVIYLEDIVQYFSCLKTDKLCPQPKRPKFFVSNLKILTSGFFCFVTFFLLFFNNETRSIWTKWLNWFTSKARNIGQCLLNCLGNCKASLTDQVIPAMVNVSHGLSSSETRTTTLDEGQHSSPNNVVITHL